MLTNARERFIIFATAGYAAVALAWIFLSDRLLLIPDNIEAMVWLSTAKGALFVIATAAMLFITLHAVPPAKVNTAKTLFEAFAIGQPTGKRSGLLMYAFAILITLSMLVARNSIAIHFDTRPLLILFMLPIILSALLGGFGPGLVSTMIAALGVSYLVIPPIHTFRIAASYDLLQWSFLLLNGFAVSFLSETLIRSQSKLELNRSLLQSIVAGTSDAIFIKDRQGRYQLINQAGAEYFGKKSADIIGLDDSFWLPEDPARAVMTTDQFIMSAGCTKTIEEEVTTLDGQKLVFLVTKGPVFDYAGKVVGLFGIARNITERKQVEQQLIKLAQAVEQSSENIVITDLNSTIEYVNEAVLKTTGYCREELIGQNIRILSSGKTPRENYAALWSALNNGRVWRGEFYNCRKDGSEYVEFASVTPIRQVDGCVTHYVAVKEDVTEKKRVAMELDQYRHHLEELVENRTLELTAAQAAAEIANKAKSEFLANMSHEIRTPLNAIIGLNYLLRENNLTPQQLERLDKTDAAAQHLLAIINDILDLAKIESGRLELEQLDFALDDVLDYVSLLVADQALDKGLRINLAVDKVPKQLRGDLTRLRQALLNYVGNAIKFSEAGTIRIRALLLEEGPHGLLIRFEVQDEGIGIPEDKQSALFETFSQIDAAHTRQYGGTGLGLAITKHLATMMGGEAGVDNTNGQGSKFWFTVRLQRSSEFKSLGIVEASIDSAVLLRQTHAGARILVAEDNLTIQEVLQDLLCNVGLSVDIAKNGLVALDKIRNHQYDLVLMDVQMPEMDGLAATKSIRSQSDYARLPILALTANAFDDDRSKCLAAGMNDFVTKPFIPDSLYAVLLKWLSRNEKNIIPGSFQNHSLEAVNEITTPVQIENIAGFEGLGGLAVVKGNITKYQPLLQMFVVTHSEDMKRVMKHLLNGDIRQCRQMIHHLSGAVAILGARNLLKYLKELDMAFHQGDNVEKCVTLAKLCDQELTKLVQAILALPQNTAIE